MNETRRGTQKSKQLPVTPPLPCQKHGRMNGSRYEAEQLKIQWMSHRKQCTRGAHSSNEWKSSPSWHSAAQWKAIIVLFVCAQQFKAIGTPSSGKCMCHELPERTTDTSRCGQFLPFSTLFALQIVVCHLVSTRHGSRWAVPETPRPPAVGGAFGFHCSLLSCFGYKFISDAENRIGWPKGRLTHSPPSPPPPR